MACPFIDEVVDEGAIIVRRAFQRERTFRDRFDKWGRGSLCPPELNSATHFLNNSFERSPINEKLANKQLGPDKPDIKLCGGQGDMWSSVGVCDLKHFSEKAKKHESSKAYLTCAMKLAMLGQANTATQLDESYGVGVRNSNKEVDKNRHILSKLIDYIRFCGAFELTLRGHDETETSVNPSVFRGLVDLVASLDNIMQEHLEHATVFKVTSTTIQNDP
ncbi:hypothetical protein QQF64_023833 [Cirrhinus molitorella]|uniref:DUF4371 domain-containing protein n=1 Tax=Cirrhinus molitorella TaxID=172907 RepID=A0ABR3NJP3_9TELE